MDQKKGSAFRLNLPVSFYLNEFSRNVLARYSTKSDNPNVFIFDIIDDKLRPEEQERKKTNFVRFIDQHFKNYAKELGIENINVKIARHSFATTAILKGKSMEFAREALGHSNIKTTQIYFSGFEDEAKESLHRG